MEADAPVALLLAAARLLWYVGILAVIGASTFRIAIHRPAADQQVPSSGRPLDTSGARQLDVAARLATAGAGALLAGLGVRLYAQTYAYFGAEEGVTATLLFEVATGLPPWSTGWLMQAAAAGGVAGALALTRVAPRTGWALVHLSVLGVAGTVPLTGHATAQEFWPRLPLVLQAGHVLGAGVWLGGLLAVLLATRAAGPEPPLRVAARIGRFSPAALAGAALLTTTGVGTAVLYLRTPRDLWSTDYGAVLLLKIAGFAAVAGIGFINWRRIRPRLDAPGGVALLRQTMMLELALAAWVLAITAWLVGQAQP